MLRISVTNLPLNIYCSVWIEDPKTKKYKKSKPTFYNFVGAEIIRALKKMLDLTYDIQGSEKGLVVQWKHGEKHRHRVVTTHRDILALVGWQKEYFVHLYRQYEIWKGKSSSKVQEDVKISYKESCRYYKLGKRAVRAYHENKGKINDSKR